MNLNDKSLKKYVEKSCLYLAENIPKRCFSYPQSNNPKIKRYCFFATGDFGDNWIICTMLDSWVDENFSQCQSCDFLKKLLEII